MARYPEAIINRDLGAFAHHFLYMKISRGKQGVAGAVAGLALLLSPALASAAVTTTSVSVDGGASTVAITNGSIDIDTDVTITSNSTWSSTFWRISTNPASGGTSGCDTSPNTSSNGSHSDGTNNAAVPGSAGTYHLYITTYGNNSCSGSGNGTTTIANAVVVVANDRTTQSATLNGASSVTVAPGASITAVVTGLVTSGNDWDGTQWRISTTPPGSTTCSNTPDNNSGTHVESFTITAPVGSGTYHAYFRITGEDDCDGQTGTLLTLSNAVTVVNPDTTAPSGYSVSIDQALINDANDTAFSFTFAGAEVGATYLYSIDDADGGTAAVAGSGAVASATEQITGINVANLSDGTLTLSVSLKDAANNTGATTTDTVAKDATAPAAPTITAAPPAYASSTDFAFAFTHGEDGVSYTCRVDADPFSACVSTTTGSSVEGARTFEVKAVDAAGNESPAASHAWTIDMTDPTGTLSSTASNPTNESPLPFTVAWGEEVTGFEVGDLVVTNGDADDFTTADNITFTFDITPQGEGAVKVSVAAGAAADLAGNPSEEVSEVSRTYAESAPSVTITSPAADGTAFDHALPTFSFSSSTSPTSGEPIVSAQCWFDFEAASACQTADSHYPSSALSEGDHIFYVEVKDNANNTSTAERAFSVDLTNPTIAQVTPVATPGTDSTPSYAFSSTEAGTIAYDASCAGGATTAAAGTNTVEFGPLADGTYGACTIVVTDASGRASNVLWVSSFTIDTGINAPVITSGPAEAGYASSSPVTIEFTVDADATAECQVDADPAYSCSGPQALALADGAHTFVVTATDSVNNTAATTRTFTLDTEAPDVALLGNATVNVTVGDVFVDEGATSTDLSATIATSGTVDDTTVGVYTLTYTATDPAGNASASVTRTVAVDADTSGSGSTRRAIEEAPGEILGAQTDVAPQAEQGSPALPASRASSTPASVTAPAQELPATTSTSTITELGANQSAATLMSGAGIPAWLWLLLLIVAVLGLGGWISFRNRTPAKP